jgi:hypothetical protein
MPQPLEILVDGKPKIIYTFRLKGKKLPSLHFYFGLLCKKGKIFDKDQSILLLT